MIWAALIVGFTLGTVNGLWLAQWRGHIPTSEEKLVRKVYRHLDEIIGATKNENQIRADLRFRVIHKRRWYWWLLPEDLRKRIADYFWPVPQIGTGTSPIPSDRRIAHYVWHSPDMRTWTIHYTAEAPANGATFLEWLTKGRPTTGGGLAQALGLEWRADLFRVERNWSKALVHLTVAGPQEALPDRPPMDVRSSR